MNDVHETSPRPARRRSQHGQTSTASMIAGVAALITAVGGTVGVLYQTGVIGHHTEAPASSPAASPSGSPGASPTASPSPGSTGSPSPGSDASANPEASATPSPGRTPEPTPTPNQGITIP